MSYSYSQDDNEFYTLTNKLSQNVDVTIADVIRTLTTKCQFEFASLENSIRDILNEL